MPVPSQPKLHRPSQFAEWMRVSSPEVEGEEEGIVVEAVVTSVGVHVEELAGEGCVAEVVEEDEEHHELEAEDGAESARGPRE
jgi:hypothetical protein